MTINGVTFYSVVHSSYQTTRCYASKLYQYVWHPIRNFFFKDHNWILHPSTYSTKAKLFAFHFFLKEKTDTFGYQDALPRLPVPPLNQTLDKFKESVRPLLNEEDFRETEEAIEAFRNGKGPVLQQMLEGYAQDKECWVEDWWLQFAYLRGRLPLITSTTWYGGDRYQGIPQQYSPGRIQTQRMARLSFQALRIHQMIQQGTYPPIKIREGLPICMNPYKLLFGTTRIPGKGVDHLATSTNATHIAVLVNNLIYRMEVYVDGKLLNERELLKQYDWILEDAKQVTNALPVSVLTGMYRNDWAATREKIKGLNPGNIEMIESALIAVRFLDAEPKTMQDQADVALKTHRNGWFDKILILNGCKNGGFSGTSEHSPCDADTVSLVVDKVFAAENYRPGELPLPAPRELAPPERLEWTFDEATEAQIKQVDGTLPLQIGMLDLKVGHFKGFGMDAIKKLNLSPDSFLQMVMQRAFFRLNKRVPLTYETAGTRIYKHARTETIRSASMASKEMCFALSCPTLTREEKQGLIRTAVSFHEQTRKEASLGDGCDRHLMGLRILDGDQDPLFKSKGYSLNFELATSQTPSQESIGGGFYPVCEEGYGVSYFPRKDYIILHVSSFKHIESTDSEKFLKSIEESLHEIYKVLE